MSSPFCFHSSKSRTELGTFNSQLNSDQQTAEQLMVTAQQLKQHFSQRSQTIPVSTSKSVHHVSSTEQHLREYRSGTN